MRESINDALTDLVKQLGGAKSVGPLLWPDKPFETAHRLLLDCLNEERPARLAPEHVQRLLALAKGRGVHAGMEFLARSLGYAQPVPIEPRDEAADLTRRVLEAVPQLLEMVARIQQLQPQPQQQPTLRSVA